MTSLSSSFLQKNTRIPLPQLENSSIKIDKKHYKLTPYAATTSSPISKRLRKTPKTTTRKKPHSLLNTIFTALDDFISSFLDPPLPPSIDPKHVLSGNFAPVNELPPTPCQVARGSLPPCIDGAYIRNGPNPQFLPRGPYHLFDGDGMLHSIKISNGKPTFCSRFVKTYKYDLEREFNSPIILNVFSSFNGLPSSLARCFVTLARVITGQYQPSHGIGSANTSLALIGGKLFALGESDLPYSIKLTPEGDIVTLGRHEQFGSNYMTFTAHPKIDAKTKESFAFRQSMVKKPFLRYFRIDPNGIKQKEVPIFSLQEPSFIHDFAITENYAIFPDSQIVMSPAEILKGRPPLKVNENKVPRLGVIRKYAENDDEMLWVDVKGVNMIHAVNAWEEDGGDTIVMVAPNVLPVEHVLYGMDLIHSSLERVEINVRKRTVKRRQVSDRNLDFGVINPGYVGKKNRYVYAAVGSPMPKISGVVKLDISLSTDDCMDSTVASRNFGHNCYGGEPIFVPRQPDNPEAEEDDGYLLTYVHNETTQRSKFLVMDAKSSTLEIVAEVNLPQRVPYGFHGFFVRDRDLQKL